MMKNKIFIAGILVSTALTGCGTANNYLAEKTVTTEYFRVYNIQTSADKNAIAKALSNGIGKDINGMQEAYPIDTSGEVPDKPAYMKLVNPLAGTALSSMLSSAGQTGFKVASCDGAVWTARSQANYNGQDAKNFSICLFQYKNGFQVDIYGALITKSGGLMQIDRDLVNSVLGDPKQFMEKAFNDTIESVHNSIPNAQISFVRGEPAPGALPWVSSSIGK